MELGDGSVRESARKYDPRYERLSALSSQPSMLPLLWAKFRSKDASHAAILRLILMGLKVFATLPNKYMQQWVGKLSEGDLSGRALELVKQDIERSLR